MTHRFIAHAAEAEVALGYNCFVKGSRKRGRAPWLRPLCLWCPGPTPEAARELQP